MLKEKLNIKNPFTPQYFIISRSEPRYELIKQLLLDCSRLPAGASHYFIQAEQDKGCICRIREGNGFVLFYEIVNHLREGISFDEIRDAIHDPANASPLAGYFYLTHTLEEKLHKIRLKDTPLSGTRYKEPHPA